MIRVIFAKPSVALVLLAVFAPSWTARAAECSRQEMERAKPHFNGGAKAFRIGELQEAAVQFKAAYQACPSPLFLYNLGQTYRQLKDFERALYFYQQFLSTTPATDERRADVENWIDRLRTQLAKENTDRQLPEANPPPTPQAPVAVSPSTPMGSNRATTEIAVRTAPSPGKRPLYKQWWLWTSVGVVAAGIGVGVAFGVERSKSSSYFAPGITF